MQSAIMGLRAERAWQPRPRRAENGQWVVSEVGPDTHTGLVATFSGGGTAVWGQTHFGPREL